MKPSSTPSPPELNPAPQVNTTYINALPSTVRLVALAAFLLHLLRRPPSPPSGHRHHSSRPALTTSTPCSAPSLRIKIRIDALLGALFFVALTAFLLDSFLPLGAADRTTRGPLAFNRTWPDSPAGHNMASAGLRHSSVQDGRWKAPMYFVRSLYILTTTFTLMWLLPPK